MVREGKTYTATTERHSDDVAYSCDGVEVSREALPAATLKRGEDGSFVGYSNAIAVLLETAIDEESQRLAMVPSAARNGVFEVVAGPDQHWG